MSQVFACEFPDDYWFDVERDVWMAQQPSGRVRLGMTDPAQTRAGKIVYVRAKSGKRCAVGKSIATIESAKWVGPFPAPFAGVVTAVNGEVLEDPNWINRDPYGRGWIVEVAAAADGWQGDAVRGEDAAGIYRQKLRDEGLTCMRCAPDAGEDIPTRGE